jgi:hypothetical protein
MPVFVWQGKTAQGKILKGGVRSHKYSGGFCSP